MEYNTRMTKEKRKRKKKGRKAKLFSEIDKTSELRSKIPTQK